MAKVFLCFGSSVRTCRFGVIHDCRLKLKGVMKKEAQRPCVASVATFAPRVCAWAVLMWAVLVLSNYAHAADGTFIKANNTTDLDQNSSWTFNGVVNDHPKDKNDIAQWDSTVTGANSTSLGNNLTWQKISILNPGGTVTIGGAFTLTLDGGAAGVTSIDMSSATQDLTVNTGVKLNQDQIWDTGSKQLTVGGAIDNNNKDLTINGAHAMSITGGFLNRGGNNTIFVNNTGVTTISGSAVSISDNNTAGRTLTFNVAGTSGGVVVSSVIQNGGSGAEILAKTGTGTLTLSGANSYTGGTTLSGGTLRLGANNTIPSSGTVTFAGGKISNGTVGSEFSDSMGALSLTINSSIDLTSGGTSTTLTFASLSTITPGTTLTINNWSGTAGAAGAGTDDHVFLTSFSNQPSLDAFLAQVNFTGFATGAIRLGSGELVPSAVPEPGTILAGCLLVGLFGWTERHRLRRLFQIEARS